MLTIGAQSTEHFYDESTTTAEEEISLDIEDNGITISDLVKLPQRARNLIIPPLSLVVKGMSTGLEDDTHQDEKPTSIEDEFILNNKDFFRDIITGGDTVDHEKIEKVSQDFMDGNYALTWLRRLHPLIFDELKKKIEIM